MVSPPPTKASVFLGRETMVDRDEIVNMRHSIENETDDATDAAARDKDVPSSDTESLGSPTSPGALLQQQAQLQASFKPSEAGPPAPKRPRGRPPGKARRTEAPRGKEASLGHRRSSRVVRAAARVSSSSATPKPVRRETKKKAAPAPAPAGKEWEIERIVDSRIEADTLRHFYLVKWRGFDAKHNTWEPKKNLDKCSDAIVEYERSKKAAG